MSLSPSPLFSHNPFDDSKLYPQDKDSYLQRAICYHHEGKHIAAIQDLCQCIHLDPSNHLAFFWRGCLLRDCHPKRALRDLGISLMLDDGVENMATYLNRAVLYMQLKQFHQAIADFVCVLRLDEANAARKNQALGTSSVLAHTQMGLIYMNHLSRLTLAVRHFSQALLIDPRNIRSLLCRAECFLRIFAVSRGQAVNALQQARRDYAFVVHLCPTVPQYYVLLGNVVLKLGRVEQARSLLRTACAIDARFIDNVEVLARAHSHLSSHDTAVSVLRDHCAELTRQFNATFSVAGDVGLTGQVSAPSDLTQTSRSASSGPEGKEGAMTGLTLHASVLNAIASLSTAATHRRTGTPMMIDSDLAATSIMARARKAAPMFLLLGRVLMRGGRYREAIQALQTSLLLKANDVDALLQLGICMVKEGQFGAAKDALTRAISCSGSKNAQAFYYRGLCKLHLREDKGMQDINTALALDNRLWQAYLTRACYYGLLRRLPKAILNCNEAIKLQPLSARAFLFRGCLKMLMRHYTGALEDLSMAIKLFPDCGIGYYNRGLCAHYMGRYQRASRDLSVALLIDRGSPTHIVYLARGLAHYKQGDYSNALLDLQVVVRHPQFQRDARVLHVCALCNHHNGRLEEAMAMYSQAVRGNRLSVEALVGKGNVLMDYLTPESLAKSRREYIRAMHLMPGCVEAYVNMAYNLQASGHLQQAWTVLSGALKLFPSHTSLLEARAIINLQKGLYSAALLDLSTAIDRLPSNAELLTNRGVVHQYMGRVSLALADFHAAATASPSYALAHYNMGTIYLHRRQLAQALEHLDKAVAAHPQDESFLINRSVARVLTKQYGGALEDLTTASLSSPSSVHVLYNRACVHAAMNNATEALRDLDLFLTHLPLDAQAYEKRAKVLAMVGQRAEALSDYSRAAAINFGDY